MKISIYYVVENVVQKFIELEIVEGVMIDIVLCCSGVLEQYKQIDLVKNKVGIYGKIMLFFLEIRDGDCIEIYKEVLDELCILLK